MKLIRDIRGPALAGHECVATIGNFDGVHLGHQAVIRQLCEQAREYGLPAVVMTFEPLPMEYFSPETAPARITAFRDKVELLDELEVDKVVCLRFGGALAALTAGEFIGRVLVEGLGVRALIVGDDFRFGNNREGDIRMLREAGGKLGFDVIPTQTYHYNGLRVSSSLIRGHLALGDFRTAAEMLGRPYRVSGKVIHGDKRGKALGYPTANMAYERVNSPLSGVYAVRVHGLDRVYEGVSSIGTRPVFDGERVRLETYIFDFVGNLYGRRISVEFVRHLRDERDFGSVEELCAQMKKDVEKARAVLKDARGEE